MFSGGEETTSLRSLEWMFLCMSLGFFGQRSQQLVFLSLVVWMKLLIKRERLVLNSEYHFTYYHKHPPQTAKRIWIPMGLRHLVEERKENRANFREEQKAVWATASSFLFRKFTRFLAPEREPAFFLFWFFFSFVRTKEKRISPW